MGGFVRTALPIVAVLERGQGTLTLADLTGMLTKHDSRRFPDDATVVFAIEQYIACLKIEEGMVSYDRNASNYTQHVALRERLVQQFLHQVVKGMERFQLYPFHDRMNSPSCYIGVPWEQVPPNEHIGMGAPASDVPLACDYRFDGLNQCSGACGVDRMTRMRALFTHLTKDVPD